MLRRHLDHRDVLPETCQFRLVAHGPVLEEEETMEAHRGPRDRIGSVEKALAEALDDAGYDVMNTVRAKAPLDEQIWAGVRAAFAQDFSDLAPA